MTTHPTAAELEEWSAEDALSTVFGTAELARLIAAVRELRREQHDVFVQISKAVYPGATKHPAYDTSWLLTEVECTAENARECHEELDKLRAENARLKDAMALELRVSIKADVLDDVEVDEVVERAWARAALKGDP